MRYPIIMAGDASRYLLAKRGDAPMDVKAFAQVAVSVGRLMMAAGPSIASLDLNPVMVGAVGEGAVVVDALLERGVRS
jgi:hypothetical protein